MFFIYASLLEFVFVNYIGRKRPRIAIEALPGIEVCVNDMIFPFNMYVLITYALKIIESLKNDALYYLLISVK